MPPVAKSQIMAKSKSYILTQPDPQGHVMSVKCEQPLDELTVQPLQYLRLKQIWPWSRPNSLGHSMVPLGLTISDDQTDGQTEKWIFMPFAFLNCG